MHKHSIREIRLIVKKARNSTNLCALCKEHNISRRQLDEWMESNSGVLSRVSEMFLSDGSKNRVVNAKEHPIGSPMWYRTHWHEFPGFGIDYTTTQSYSIGYRDK